MIPKDQVDPKPTSPRPEDPAPTAPNPSQPNPPLPYDDDEDEEDILAGF